MGVGAVFDFAAERIAYRGVGQQSDTGSYAFAQRKLHGDIVKTSAFLTKRGSLFL